MTINEKLAEELGIKLWQAEKAVELLDGGNTVPFISRYRKEETGELNDEILRTLEERLNYLRSIEERKADVKRIIEEQGNLTPEILTAIDTCTKLAELEDIYRPFRPKRKTRATVAKAKGLEPLALRIHAQNPEDADILAIASEYIDEEKGVSSADDAISGAMDIIAEMVSDNADYRKKIREITLNTGIVRTSAVSEEDSVYRMYYDFSEGCKSLAPHQTLTNDKEEKEGFLSVTLECYTEKILAYLKRKEVSKKVTDSSKYVEEAVCDAYLRLIQPSIEREIRNELTEAAQEQAMSVFKVNLKNLLMQPPIQNKVVIGLDPGYRTGCKVGVVDGTGKVLDTGVIFVTHSQAQKKAAADYIKGIILKYNVDLISIGNGTASKETEMFAAEVLHSIPNCKTKYIITNEAGHRFIPRQSSALKNSLILMLQNVRQYPSHAGFRTLSPSLLK